MSGDTRRSFLAGVGIAATAGLAGCTGSNDSDSSNGSDSSDTEAGSTGSAGSAPQTLTMIDWSYVYSNDVIEKFESRHDCTVERAAAQGSAETLSQLRAGRADYDLVPLGNYAVTPAMEEGYLQPLNLDRIPAYEEVFEFLKKDYFEQNGEVYGVPRSFGQTPLAVNTDLADREVTALADLWDSELEGLAGGRDDARLQVLYRNAAVGTLLNPTSAEDIDREALRADLVDQDVTALADLWDDDLAGLVGGRDDARLQVLYRNAAVGAELNPTSEDDVDLDALREDLIDRLNNTGGLWGNGGESEQLLRSEQVGVQPVWNYVIQAMQSEGLPVERVYPEEGTKAWFIQFTVRDGADNPDLAHKFIQEWFTEMGYQSLMKPSNIAVPNEQVFDEQNVDPATFGVDDPDQFIYEDPKPQSLIQTYSRTWSEAKTEADL